MNLRWTRTSFALLLIVVTFSPIAVQSQDTQPNAQVIWMNSRLLVRYLPFLDSPAVGSLEAGALIVVNGRSADELWYQTIAENGRDGWVAAEYVRLAVAIDTLPITNNRNLIGMDWRLSDDVIAQIQQIYAQGQMLGNRGNVFSKVGDSITAAPHFLTAVSGTLLELGTYSRLNPMIEYYRSGQARMGDSFVTESLAAGSGWTASIALDPDYADESWCLLDESPLLCEYRINQPSIALIMFGTNDLALLDRSSYRYHMEVILQTTIDNGIIPIVSTIPYREDYGDKARDFNDVVAELAQRYQIPMWDYGAAMQNLPDQGLSPDGVHPSIPPGGADGAADFRTPYLVYGYTMRNLTALLMLDAVWQGVYNSID